jgi:hypothetical protein
LRSAFALAAVLTLFGATPSRTEVAPLVSQLACKPAMVVSAGNEAAAAAAVGGAGRARFAILSIVSSPVTQRG